MKVLIIEDKSNEFRSIKTSLEEKFEGIDIYPKTDNREDNTLNNKGVLLQKIRNSEFQSVIESYTDIDLFIVDYSLNNNDDDLGGLFLKFLKDRNYCSCKYDFIITSQHNDSTIKHIEFNSENQYVSKSKWGDEFQIEISRLVEKLYDPPKKVNIDSSLNDTKTQSKGSFNKKDWKTKRGWITLPDILEKHFIHRFILLIFYSLILVTSSFAIYGVCIEAKNYFFSYNKELTSHLENKNSALDIINYKNDSLIIKGINLENMSHRQLLASALSKFKTSEDKNQTILLEFVEHIFLYLLPLFIVLSFLSYYKSTIEIRLTGGNTRDINHEGAMKSLNNSKYILLSSLLSYTLIKMIEKIFVKEETNIVILVSFGIFIIILMAFIVLLHKSND